MNSKKSTACICTTQGYAPDCPQAFMQNGTLMHTLAHETKLKPREYVEATPDISTQNAESGEMNVMQYLDTQIMSAAGNNEKGSKGITDNGLITQRPSDHEGFGVSPLRPFGKRAETFSESDWVTDNDMKQSVRGQTATFNPLQYNGMTMTEATIGGFRIDMQVAQKKLTEYVPLPPVFLPMIFMDKDLNFFHHFFQGMEILMGKDTIDRIVEQEKHYVVDDAGLLQTIKQLIMSGVKHNDNELTLFVKRVLTGTFDTLPNASLVDEKDELIVALNMWGFQYIEPGMRCKDNDLRMWLHMSHLKYKVSWFNAFKSAGIPKFAMSGVQDRYESMNNHVLDGKLDYLTPEKYNRKEMILPIESASRQHRKVNNKSLRDDQEYISHSLRKLEKKLSRSSKY